jgi:hypothetical protein
MAKNLPELPWMEITRFNHWWDFRGIPKIDFVLLPGLIPSGSYRPGQLARNSPSR